MTSTNDCPKYRLAHGQRGGPPRRSHAGPRAEILLDGIVEPQQPGRAAVSRVDRIDEHGEHALGAIAAVDGIQVRERAEQEPRCKEQDHGGGHLGGGERGARPAAARRCRSALGGNHLCQRRIGRLPRGRKAEQCGNGQRRERAEGEHAQVEGQGDRSRQQVRRDDGRRNPQDGRSESDAEQSTHHAEDEAFGQQLSNDA